jgi:indolepyruvate ferredoxin oxidoreductase, alpha subunit
LERLPDLLIQPDPWSGLIMGNHALVRAMLESGVSVATTYPGSPTPEIAAAIESIPADKRSLYFEYSTNEKVALEVAFGAAINGQLSTSFFKSVGLNVASDTAVQLPMMEIIGGMVIVLGDDPGANSSQNEQDNRHFARMAYMPMFEPATPTEAYEMFGEAAALAKKMKMPIFFRMTTHVCHARQVVQFGSLPTESIDTTPRFDRANGPYVPIAADVFPLKKKALTKLGDVERYSENASCNEILSPNGAPAEGQKKLGLIAASMPALSLLENLDSTGATLDLLKLGLSYPLPRKKILSFLESHDEVLIVEELDRIMEQEIKSLALDHSVTTKIRTRGNDLDGMMGELGPVRTYALLSECWPDLFPPENDTAPRPSLSPRIAQMCPGCGHRAAFFAVKRSLAENDITVADIGCHSMGYYPPHTMGEVLLCMGAGNGTAAGMTIGNDTRKVVTFIGDSTFFHAGIPAIINAVIHNHDFTLVVMENGTTAMTGHQPHPGSKEIADKISIQGVLETLGVKFIRSVDAYDQKRLQPALKEAMEFEGFAVVIAKHPCMLKFTREQRKKGSFAPRTMQVQTNCDQSHVCVEDFACPSFIRGEDGTITVNEELCIGDGSCVAVCPVGALAFSEPQAKE